ncbi:enoyl-CoA hydratase/isomerase family protein [Agromyces binzhouensis]|uniref:enoyl-CoA hydratase/isomerase family protein n=1 Tax=Agromyces binzhouensis TaxID=1817495 RepID=UPI00362559D7
MTLATALRDDGILIAAIDRPDKGNALDTPTIDALGDLAAGLHAGEHPQVRAVVITGSGDRAFSAGADISTLHGLTANQARRQMIHGQDVFDRIEELPQLTIAAINGVAFGGGLELAMACDLRTAAATARMGQPEITLANLPGWGGTQRLPRLIGTGRALELILTGNPIDAATAHSYGLVNVVADDAVAAAVALAAQVIRHAPGAVAACKEAVLYGVRHGIAHGLRREAELVGERCATPEQRAAVKAFLNRKSTTTTKAETS